MNKFMMSLHGSLLVESSFHTPSSFIFGFGVVAVVAVPEVSFDFVGDDIDGWFEPLRTRRESAG